MKISAIFSDYDGTLSLEDVPKESSSVPKAVEEELIRIASLVPVAIVTSKDFYFVNPRTLFANAWACVGGLEIVLPDGTTLLEDTTDNDVQSALEYAKHRNTLGLSIELKHSTTGKLLGFSIDWRNKSKPPDEFIGKMTAELRRRNLVIVRDSLQPFFDVFGGSPNKGEALRKLKGLLNVTGKVLYIGDSPQDNSAFDEADVGICVMHNQALENLRCRFVIEYGELSDFLHSLADNKMVLDTQVLHSRKR